MKVWWTTGLFFAGLMLPSGAVVLSFFFPLTEMQTLFFHVVGRGGVGEHEVFRYLWLSYVAGGGHEA